MIKRISWIPAVISLTLLGGCIPSLTNDTEVVKETEENEVETTIIPSMQLSDQYYRTLLPYEQSASRGLIVSNVHSKYDVKEVENGLIRLSQRSFSTDDYFFQEGQTLDADTLRLWLARSSQDELGLNPATTEDMPAEQRATKAPIYLAHIVEQNYLKKTDDNTVRLGGISIGLALNSIYYYKNEEYTALEEPIPHDDIEKNGKKMANEIVKRLRAIEGLEKVPITVGLFKQESRNAIVPGSYFAYGTSTEGKGNIAEWTPLNEGYLLIPAPLAADEKYRDVANSFAKFKQDVDTYFSNFTSVIGTGFYQDDQIKNLKIDIPVQLYGTAEIIGFTQYMAGLVMQHFPASMQVEVSVTSISGPEAFLIKKADDKEPYVHIYD